MRNVPQTGYDGFQACITHGQRITSGKKDIPDLRCTGYVIDRLLYPVTGGFMVFLSGKTAPGTMTAIHGTLVRNQEKHPVRVSVCQARNRGIFVFM